MLLKFPIQFIEIISGGNINSLKLLMEVISVSKQFHSLIADGKEKNSNYHKQFASIENVIHTLLYWNWQVSTTHSANSSLAVPICLSALSKKDTSTSKYRLKSLTNNSSWVNSAILAYHTKALVRVPILDLHSSNFHVYR